MSNDHIWHGNHIPASVSDLLSGIQSHECVSSLEVSIGSKQNGTLSSWTLTIACMGYLPCTPESIVQLGDSSVSCS